MRCFRLVFPINLLLLVVLEVPYLNFILWYFFAELWSFKGTVA
jgi:hypothetical protein